MTTAAHQPVAFDAETVRRQFPALKREVYGKPLVYLDSAASAQKPETVIEAELRCYREYYSNVHRGVHRLSQESTEAYEAARQKVSTLIGAGCPREVVFVRGTTEGINLVAQTFGRQRVKEGDEVLITAMEHHSNIVPWQILCEQQGAKLVVAPMNQKGELIWDEFEKRLTDKVKLLAFVHVSNALGTVNPVREIADRGHEGHALQQHPLPERAPGRRQHGDRRRERPVHQRDDRLRVVQRSLDDQWQRSGSVAVRKRLAVSF